MTWLFRYSHVICIALDINVETNTYQNGLSAYTKATENSFYFFRLFMWEIIHTHKLKCVLAYECEYFRYFDMYVFSNIVQTYIIC